MKELSKEACVETVEQIEKILSEFTYDNRGRILFQMLAKRMAERDRGCAERGEGVLFEATGSMDDDGDPLKDRIEGGATLVFAVGKTAEHIRKLFMMVLKPRDTVVWKREGENEGEKDNGRPEASREVH